MGVIRYGRDTVVAVIDSTQAGRNVREWLPGASTSRSSRRLDEALAASGPAGRAADRHRADRRQAARRRGGRRSSRRSAPGSTSTPGCTRSSATTPSSPRRPRPAGVRDRRLPAAAGADGDVRRPPPRAGQAGDPDRRHRLRDRQDVGRAGAAAGRRARPAQSAVFVADRPDRDDDRGLGRRGRPADQRLRPGHRRVAGRARARARATGSSSRARGRSTTRPTSR